MSDRPHLPLEALPVDVEPLESEEPGEPLATPRMSRDDVICQVRYFVLTVVLAAVLLTLAYEACTRLWGNGFLAFLSVLAFGGTLLYRVVKWPETPARRARRLALEEVIAEAEQAEAELAADIERRAIPDPIVATVLNCVFLGGRGAPPLLEPGRRCRLDFTTLDLYVRDHPCWPIAWVGNIDGIGIGGGTYTVEGEVMNFPMQNGAAGAIVKGPSTTRIETVLAVRGPHAELYFAMDHTTPQQLRIGLSPLLSRVPSRVDVSGSGAPVEPPPLPAPTKRASDSGAMVEQLRELAQLHESGALTAEEYSSAKARLLGS